MRLTAAISHEPPYYVARCLKVEVASQVRRSRNPWRISRRHSSSTSRTCPHRNASSLRSLRRSNSQREPRASDRLGSRGRKGTSQSRLRSDEPTREPRKASSAEWPRCDRSATPRACARHFEILVDLFSADSPGGGRRIFPRSDTLSVLKCGKIGIVARAGSRTRS